MQQKYGSDKLVVILLSVDAARARDDRYLGRTKKIMEKFKIDWPNVFLPGGWNDLMRKFNLDGYGLTVIDGKGIVRGIDVYGGDLEKLVDPLINNKKADHPQHQ